MEELLFGRCCRYFPFGAALLHQFYKVPSDINSFHLTTPFRTGIWKCEMLFKRSHVFVRESIVPFPLAFMLRVTKFNWPHFVDIAMHMARELKEKETKSRSVRQTVEHLVLLLCTVLNTNVWLRFHSLPCDTYEAQKRNAWLRCPLSFHRIDIAAPPHAQCFSHREHLHRNVWQTEKSGKKGIA